MNNATIWRFLWQKGVLWTNNRTILATKRSLAPTLYDTQATYNLYEYTYWTTKYYRKVPVTYTAAWDIFYAEPTMETEIASRYLTIL